MKSLKKTLVLLVVFSMILSAVMPAFAATDIYGLDCEEEVARLEALKVVTGYEDGTYGPEKTITRAEMAVILCKMVGIDTVTVDENKNVPSKFSDVAAGDWYTGYINVAAGKGLLSGFPDGTFRPNEQLTMNQVLTLCVNALGRGEYVSEMGTWPANYIAEATKLGLLDGVKTSDANRGNVAIIVWNTLEAPYVWDVMGTEFEGTINLQNSKRSLLSIYFRDYTYEKNDELRELKEIETVVAGTPSREPEIGDRQIVLSDYDADIVEDFEIKTTLKKKDVKEECTYVNEDDEIVAYVPEDVYEDIESLRGKTVTLVFGKDNVVALVVIEDDIVSDELLTKYAASDKKITVGGEVYKLASKVTVTLNDADYDSLSDALDALGVKDMKDIEKNIQAQLTLDINNKVEKIDLFASANIKNVSTEAVVQKVRETSKKYKIETTAGDITWELDEEDDLDFPRVYIDGTLGDIRDIEVGNVVTVLGESLALEDITAVYVSTKTVVGEAKKVRKADQAITIDGEVYLSSMVVYDEDAGTYAKIMIEDEIDDAWTEFDSTSILDNDEVTLYMNILGEYVAVAISETISDYQFGIVTAVYSGTDYEVENEDEYAIRSLRILTADGNTSRYKVKVNLDDKDTPDVNDLGDVFDGLDEGTFVMFKANSDRVIELEEEVNRGVAEEILAVTDYFDDEYEVKSALGNNVTVKAKTFKIASKDGVATTKTVIFNNHKKDTNISDDKTNREVVSNWDSIVDNGKIDSTKTVYAVFEKDDDEALYIVVDMADYSSTDAEYAIVDKKLHEGKDGTWTIGIVGSEDEVEVKKAVAKTDALVNAKDWLIRYTTASNEVDYADKLINLDKFENELDDEEIITEDIVVKTGTEVKLSDKLTNFTKTHLEVADYSEDDDYAYIQYVKDVDEEVTPADVFATGTYYEKETYYAEATVADQTALDAGTYYVKNGSNYEEVTAAYDADTTYYTEEERYVVAKEYNASKTYYLDNDGTDTELDHDDLEVASTLGKVWLDVDELVVLNVSEGEVVTAKLSDTKGRTVVVYDATSNSDPDIDGYLVIILD